MPSRFVIIAMPRTGSTHLVSLLGQHPEIHCHGEIFHPKGVFYQHPDKNDALTQELAALRSADTATFMDRVCELSCGKSHVGFKIFPAHNDQFRDRLIRSPNVRKIVLFRDNALAQYASDKAARAVGDYSLGNTSRPKATFEATEFARRMNYYAKALAHTFHLLADAAEPYFLLRYDELGVHDRIRSLAQFIGTEWTLPPQGPAPRRTAHVLDRFANPESAAAFLQERDLLHWQYESALVI